jgi:hypothetical protein
MNQLPISNRVAIVAALVEGNSIRSTARMTAVSKTTILKLLADLGTECAAFHNATVRNIRAQRIQCDEIWQFVGAKQKNATTARSQLLLPVSDNYFCRRRGSKGVSPTTWRHSVVVVGRSVAVTCSAGAPTGAEAPAAIPGT